MTLAKAKPLVCFQEGVPGGGKGEEGGNALKGPAITKLLLLLERGKGRRGVKKVVFGKVVVVQ